MKRGQLDLLGGWTPTVGPYLRAEAMYRPWENVGVFSYGQISRTETGAGLGLRLKF